MDRIRVGFIGCGQISDLHALAYRNRQDAQIQAVCSVDMKSAESKANKWGATKVYADYRDLLDDPDIDLVEVLVPHDMHANITVDACSAGKNVSVQKPMALTLAEADRMIAAAERNGTILRIYENFVFYPPHVRAKEMIEAGEIGEPQMIRIHVSVGKFDGGWHVPEKTWAWRFRKELCGGGPLVFDHGYHLFSLAYHLMGDVERVYAWIDRCALVAGGKDFIDAPAVIVFKFTTGQRYGVLDFAYAPQMVIDSRFYTDDDRIEVVGDRGILFVNRCTARTVDRPELVLFRDGKTTAIGVDRVEWDDSFVACTNHLIEVLRSGGKPCLDGDTGRSVLRFSLAAQMSASLGKEIRVHSMD